MKKFLFLLICMVLFVQPFSVEAFNLNQGLNILRQGADTIQKDQKAKQKLDLQKLEDARNGGNKAKIRAEDLLDQSEQHNISLSTLESQLRRDLSALNDVLFNDNPDAIHSASSSLRRSSDEFEMKLDKTIRMIKEQKKKAETARIGANKAKQRAKNLLSIAQGYGISMTEKEAQLKNDLIVLDKVINENNPDKIDSATKYVTSSSDKFEAKLNIEKIPIDKLRKKEVAERAKIEKERREKEAVEKAKVEKERQEREAVERAKAETEKKEAIERKRLGQKQKRQDLINSGIIGRRLSKHIDQMPLVEIDFINAVAKGREIYRSAANEMAKGASRPKRKQMICELLNSGSVSSWIGRIAKLDTNSEGKGVFAVEIADGIRVQTWNNALSDMGSSTLIEPNSDLFQKLVSMSKGDIVKVSGSFFGSDIDCVEEQSLSLSGSVKNPEFTFRFSSVEKLAD